MSKRENNIPVVDGVEEPVKKPSKTQRIISAVINVVLVIAIVLAVLALRLVLKNAPKRAHFYWIISAHPVRSGHPERIWASDRLPCQTSWISSHSLPEPGSEYPFSAAAQEDWEWNAGVLPPV